MRAAKETPRNQCQEQMEIRRNRKVQKVELWDAAQLYKPSSLLPRETFLLFCPSPQAQASLFPLL